MKNNNKKRMKEAKKHVHKISDNGRKTTYMTKAMEEKIIAQIRKTREKLWREKIGLGS